MIYCCVLDDVPGPSADGPMERAEDYFNAYQTGPTSLAWDLPYIHQRWLYFQAPARMSQRELFVIAQNVLQQMIDVHRRPCRRKHG